MKVSVICIGKTDRPYLKTGIAEYQGRLEHYLPFELIELPDLKQASALSASQVKEKEAELLKKKLPAQACIVLLDEHGKEYRSVEFAGFMQQRMNQGIKHIAFVVGGAYGFHQDILKTAAYKISLSKGTFSHQLVRLIFLEQLYRAMTILKNEPYHNE